MSRPGTDPWHVRSVSTDTRTGYCLCCFQTWAAGVYFVFWQRQISKTLVSTWGWWTWSCRLRASLTLNWSISQFYVKVKVGRFRGFFLSITCPRLTSWFWESSLIMDCVPMLFMINTGLLCFRINVAFISKVLCNSVATKIENGPKTNTKILRFLKIDRRRRRRIFVNSKILRRSSKIANSSKIFKDTKIFKGKPV